MNKPENIPNMSERLKSEQEIQWGQKRKEIDKIVDALGKEIEEGIKETVIAFNVYGIPTSQSCEGHIDPKIHTEGYSPAMAPWVEIYPEEPEQEDWIHDDELRKRVTEESRRYFSEIVHLLNEFYNGQEVPDDVKLTTGKIAYGFRVQSGGLESLTNPNDKDQREKAKQYQEEMKRFTLFLKAKFLNKE